MLSVVKSSGPLALLRRNEWVWVRTGHISKHSRGIFRMNVSLIFVQNARNKTSTSPEKLGNAGSKGPEPSEIDETHFDNGR